MTRLREELDADRIDTGGPTRYRSLENPYEIRCSVCGTTYYASEEPSERTEYASEQDLENTFVCAECEADYETLAHERGA